MKNKWIYTLLIVSLLILSVPTVSAGKQLKIVNSIHMPESNQIQPSIFEDTVVFVDDGNSNPNIVIYDLNTGNKKHIVSDPNTPQHPHIRDSMVVWEDLTVTNWDIFLYYPNLNEDVQITHNYANQTNPFIFGNYIAWQDDRNGNWDIFLYNIETEEERQITNSSADQVSPIMTRMSVEIELVWLDKGKDGEDSEIYELRLRAFNESLDNIKQITNDTSDQAHIAASLDNVVFSSDEGGSYNIYINDWEIELTNQITFDDVDQKYPAFDLDNIVWIDDRTGYDEIYQFGLIFQEQFQLTDSKTPKSDVQIKHNWVVWVEDRGGDKDIHYLSLLVNTQEKAEAFNPQFIIGLSLIFGAVFILVKTFKKPKPKYIPTAAEINKLSTKEDLTRACEKYGLNPEGNKKRLRKRLISFIENEKKIDIAEPTEGETVVSKLKRLSTKANQKFTALVADESDTEDTDEFDIDIDEPLEDPEEKPKLGKMDEAIYEIQEHLTEQKGELEVLKDELKSLTGASVKKKKKVKIKRKGPVLSVSEKEDVLRIVDIVLKNLPEEITKNFSGSDYYLLYEKVLEEYKRKGPSNSNNPAYLLNNPKDP